MAISDNESAFVDASSVSIGLSQMFTITPGSSDPTYLVLTVLDRNEYTVSSTGATGTLTGDGNTLGLGDIGGDGRGTGIVFTYTYDSATGQYWYYNSTYGWFNQVTYTSSRSPSDVTNLSVFGTNSLSLADSDATNAVAMVEYDGAGYLGSATVVTQPGYTATVPTQATPDSIASVAKSFVGDAWNLDGCWVLASTIAAEAGTSLPVQSTLIGIPGAANGEWIVAFNGPAGQTGNWENMVTAGEMIVIGTSGGGGHITTCVSGSGSTAMLVDNVTYVNNSGQIQNPANDGSSNDIIVSSPHLASQEWSGVSASTVVIYEAGHADRHRRRHVGGAQVPGDAVAGLAVLGDRSGQQDDHRVAGLRHGTQRLAGGRRHRLQRPRRLRRPVGFHPCLDIPARRRDGDDRYAGGTGVQRQLLGRLGCAERDDRRDRTVDTVAADP